MAEALERCERALQRLLGQLGCVEPASAAFRAALLEYETSAAELQREPQPGARLQRLLVLNALVQDAVRREREGVGRQIAQVRVVRESLAQAAQPVETGDSCDVRG